MTGTGTSCWGMMTKGIIYMIALDKRGVISYYKSMKSTLTVKREIETKQSGFCTCCGNRYEAGSKMVVLNEEPSARGNIAHASCVVKNNAKVEKMAEKFKSGECYQGVEA